MEKLRYFRASGRGSSRDNTIIAVDSILKCIRACNIANCTGFSYCCAYKYIDNKWIKIGPEQGNIIVGLENTVETI